MNIKLKVKPIVFLILMLLTMFAIFGFSAQDGNDSSGLSSSVSRILCKLLFSGFDSMTAEQQLFVVLGIHHFVRKAAHFSVYAALGFFSYLFLHLTFTNAKGMYWFSVLFCAVYAVIDEIHQYYTPGRAAQIRDMLLDTAGAAVGAIVAVVAAIVWAHIREQCGRKKYKPEEVS